MPQAQGAALIPDRLRRAVNTVVVHCSATPSGRYLPGAAPVLIDRWHRARGFRRSHTARRQFNGDLASIGYHYVVDVDGRTWTGRSLEEAGAHAFGHNAHSVGICLVGGAELDARYTREQWEALAHLVKALTTLCKGPHVLGHRDLSPDANGDGTVQRGEWFKTCPGFDVATWLANDMTPLAEHVAHTALGPL
ncbi:MAG: N-acetylmuramoyl-L-alanine amidase [Rubrivivax sp.]|nr:N-acetylmuramoyl-L-alanine amidase [Rubrivivax sp.]